MRYALPKNMQWNFKVNLGKKAASSFISVIYFLPGVSVKCYVNTT